MSRTACGTWHCLRLSISVGLLRFLLLSRRLCLCCLLPLECSYLFYLKRRSCQARSCVEARSQGRSETRVGSLVGTIGLSDELRAASTIIALSRCGSSSRKSYNFFVKFASNLGRALCGSLSGVWSPQQISWVSLSSNNREMLAMTFDGRMVVRFLLETWTQNTCSQLDDGHHSLRTALCSSSAHHDQHPVHDHGKDPWAYVPARFGLNVFSGVHASVPIVSGSH